ncbi:hypothetical protein C0991_009480 [Blastosporella zonata]|nr:hypothetical protein C0991_009480 [Blastosporella zonata]
MAPVAIPQELIDTIIDELADNQAALFKCSLVSHVFRDVARKHIFREITVSFNPLVQPSYNAEALFQILLNNSALAPLVESLILHLTDLQPTVQNVALFDVFPKVKKLTFTSPGNFTDWHVMPEHIRGSLAMLLSQPSLNSLTLKRQNNFPIDLLLLSPNIVGLAIESSSSERSLPLLNSYADQSSAPSPHLQSLSVVVYGGDPISLSILQDSFKVFARSLIHVRLDFLGYEDGRTPRKSVSR